ncbi:hypothetical protein FJZ55_10150 [Candidatus Woesearchaeota archaeon]|nr:hypothetical protein [Candidatus Woesearchaeota archaeon]
MQTKEFTICCSICKKTHDFSKNPYESVIRLSRLCGNDKIINCFENKTTIKELVLHIIELVGNPFITVWYNHIPLTKNDENILSTMDIHDGSVISYNQRLPHQFTEEDNKLADNGYCITIGS